ncbi:GGDEF domain-containing protein [Exiguobacterium sp. SL-10]|uniref:GGDEF domain-containing protein n=1 Tax=unclassified Exiguobacterium TaxID=2644629 RepID=UPI00103C55E9|nr:MULTISPECIES: GGDEF domain-containing protein [unclassified Exiguobacterium]TCI22611.1 GGDEF domain-containing protein [Exiguobacterium sp. SL-9]TCI30411.1 GGDEF domain-containing protein [Exiguobacterium sp. SL-10]
MDTSFRKASLISMQVFLLLIAVTLLAFYAPNMGSVHLESMLLMMFAATVSLFIGIRAGLVTSLAILFCFGSLYFWNMFFRPNDQVLLFSEVTLLYYGVCLIGLVILSGTLYENVHRMSLKNQELQDQVRQLVAIDAETGLDNKERFMLELQLEIDRTKRHGEAFTVFLYKIDYLTEFKKLYGDREYERFLLHFSKQLHYSTRTTDKKFRLSNEEFAVILPYASEEHMSILTERFRNMIGDYRTDSNKTVTFTNHIAYYTVKKNSDIESPDDILGLIGNELKSYAL